MIKSILLAAALLSVTVPVYAGQCNPCATERTATDISDSVLCVSGAERWKTKMFLHADGSITVRTGNDNRNGSIPAWRWSKIPAGTWWWSNGQVHTNTFIFNFHSTI